MKISVRDFDFQGTPIKCVGTDRDLWFVAKDVCEALGIAWKGSETLDCIPKEWRGVRKLRTPLKNQYGSHGLVENEFIVINEYAIYKLAFRSNKPAADAFTNWVASEVIPSIRKTGTYAVRQRAKYERLGKSIDWVEKREEGIEARKDFTGTLKDHGVSGHGYPSCTDAINRPILGGSAAVVKIQRGLKPKANLRDSLSKIELAKVQLAEMLATERIEADKLNGNESCAKACKLSGQSVANASELASGSPLV